MARADPDPPPARYRAFISYSHADDAVARWLHRALERFVIPRELRAGDRQGRRRLFPVFRDREEFAATANLAAGIVEALRSSETLIVICSPAAAQSTWVDHELRQFRTLHPDRPVLALLADGEPNARTEARECLPPSLRAGAAGLEPIAADIRPGGDGRRQALLKLAAGILGVGLDDLARRDRVRRQRLRLAGAAAAMLVIAALSVALVFALRAQAEAERQRGEAEGLIEFMITDLRKKLEPAGKLGLMDAVGARALRYYGAQDKDALDPDALGRRARTLHLIGEIEVQHGDLAAASANFAAAAVSTGELLKRDPDDPARIYDHSQSVFWVGNIAYLRGQIAPARAAFEQYRALAEKLVAIDPRSAAWRNELKYSYSNIGSLELCCGDLRAAQIALKRAYDLSAAGLAENPGDKALQVENGMGLAWLAEAHARQGLNATALLYRTKEVRIYEPLLADSGYAVEARLGLAKAERATSELLRALGKVNDARPHAERAAAEAHRLVEDDPANADWGIVSALADVELGRALYAVNDLAGARHASQRAQASLLAANPAARATEPWKAAFNETALLQRSLPANAQTTALP